jgi:guanosine-3',5'-bis(diphosphate) 3'-pyrophosphohydrolase
MQADRLLKALTFAAQKHSRQRRKDRDASPYVNHLIAVAYVLAAEGGATNEDLLLAAFLHDTIEDTPTSLDELREEFGGGVADLVAEVTDDRALPKRERKHRQVLHAPALSEAAKQLKIADKICNVRDMVDSPPVLWTRRRRREYLDWSEQVVAGCRGVNARLDEAFDAALARGRRALGDGG